MADLVFSFCAFSNLFFLSSNCSSVNSTFLGATLASLVGNNATIIIPTKLVETQTKTLQSQSDSSL